MGSKNPDQFKFTLYTAMLIMYVYSKGYTMTYGDAWAKAGEGRKHSKNSLHYDRLAIDLNLFKDGKYLSETSDHQFAGEFWENLDDKCTWGGRFKDGNHYSFGE